MKLSILITNIIGIIGVSTTLLAKSPLQVNKLAVEHKQIDSKRDPYFPEKDDWTTKTDLLWSVRAYDLFYWENNVYFEMDHAVRHIGWHYYAGLNSYAFKWLDFVWEHHSRHVAEKLPPTGSKFPVEDSYGFRINFIK